MSVAAKPAEGAVKSYGHAFDGIALAIAPALAKLAWEVIKRPAISVPVGVVAAVILLIGPWALYATALVLSSVLIAWRWQSPRTFKAVVGRPSQAAARGFWRYKTRWTKVMRGCGLTATHNGSERVPRAGRITVGKYADTMSVWLLPGQHVGDYEKNAPGLAAGFNAAECGVREGKPGRVTLVFKTGEPLADVIPALPIPDMPDERAAEAVLMPPATGFDRVRAWFDRQGRVPEPVGVDLEAVGVGIREDASPWTMQIRGTHILAAGVSGAGKSGVLWGLIRGVAPMIRDGLVAIWAIDPKGGIELSPGEPLYARYEDKDPEAMIELLEAAVVEMKARAARMKAEGIRKHEPTLAEPHLIVIVDEVANLTAYLSDRNLKNRALQALGLLLTQGRAPGVTVIAALQDPRKEVLNLRNLFPTKVAMRLDEPIQVNMVLGDGARERGALCDRIPHGLPGVGYVRLEGQREPERVRAAYVTDEDIAEMVEAYQPRLAKRLELA